MGMAMGMEIKKRKHGLIEIVEDVDYMFIDIHIFVK